MSGRGGKFSENQLIFIPMKLIILSFALLLLVAFEGISQIATINNNRDCDVLVRIHYRNASSCVPTCSTTVCITALQQNYQVFALSADCADISFITFCPTDGGCPNLCLDFTCLSLSPTGCYGYGTSDSATLPATCVCPSSSIFQVQLSGGTNYDIN